jgi:hypothetical protein
MADLTDSKLDDFVRRARESHLAHNPRPLLADRVELLVAEVRRLRAGIDAHQTTVLHAPPCRHCVSEVVYADKRLWSLVEEDSDAT